MSIDLNFWKYRNGKYLDNAAVYRNACCNNCVIEDLELLPIEDILKETAAAFAGWDSPAPDFYEQREGQGSFQITTTPQTVRFDCNSMDAADMKRFSTILSRFGCPLYDPQLGVRYDRIAVFLIDEAGEYRAQAEQELSRLLPRLEIVSQTMRWEDYVNTPKTLSCIEYNALIHRAKTQTKVTSFMKFGSAWTNRPCQCKTAQLEDAEQGRQLLGELLQKSIQRVVKDFLERTYYE